jgi:hypothetical protein
MEGNTSQSASKRECVSDATVSEKGEDGLPEEEEEEAEVGDDDVDNARLLLLFFSLFALFSMEVKEDSEEGETAEGAVISRRCMRAVCREPPQSKNTVVMSSASKPHCPNSVHNMSKSSAIRHDLSFVYNHT